MTLSTRTKLIGLLGLGAALAGAAVVPYQAELAPEIRELPISLGTLSLIAGLQTGVLCGVLSWLGLWAATPVNLGAPVLEAWLEGQAPSINRLLTLMGLGVVAGLVIAGVDGNLILPLLPDAGSELPSPSATVALGASLYGAIVEELLLRLFLLSVVAWVLSWPARRKKRPFEGAITAAVVVSALLFGLGHLPAAASVWPLTPIVVARVIGLNLLFGMGFGLLYVRYGLFAAMCAHFGADLGLHVLPRLFG
ncbi:MAG: CPBP family intramembrane glutamic endopeptidase [Myxococcota bacterium]